VFCYSVSFFIWLPTKHPHYFLSFWFAFATFVECTHYILHEFIVQVQYFNSCFFSFSQVWTFSTDMILLMIENYWQFVYSKTEINNSMQYLQWKKTTIILRTETYKDIFDYFQEIFFNFYHRARFLKLVNILNSDSDYLDEVPLSSLPCHSRGILHSEGNDWAIRQIVYKKIWNKGTVMSKEAYFCGGLRFPFSSDESSFSGLL